MIEQERTDLSSVPESSPSSLSHSRLSPSRSGARTNLAPIVPLLWLMSLNLAGCTVVKGIFKAGVWVGVLGVCAVLALLMYGASRLGRRS